MQEIIVGIILFIALSFLGRKLYLNLTGKGGCNCGSSCSSGGCGCGSSCSGYGEHKEAAK